MDYKNVYFRINTPDYNFNNGWSEEQANEFDNDAKQIFVLNGWEVQEARSYSSCTTVIKGRQHLYLHPQSFSGEVLEDNIIVIEQILKVAKAFEHYNTDIYETRYALTNEEYKSLLDNSLEEINNDILQAFKTKRSNLYHTSAYGLLSSVMNKYSVSRLGLGHQDGYPCSYAGYVFEELINKGFIIKSNTKSGEGYRTINKTEQKQLKLAIA